MGVSRHTRLQAIIGLLVVAVGGPLTAADINVPGDQPTIQSAIVAAVSGDRIIVTGGAYTEALTVSGKTLTFVPQFPLSLVTINAPTGQPALRATGGSNLHFERFNLLAGDGAGATPSSDGQTGADGIIVNSSSVALETCTVQGGDGGDASTQFTSVGGDGGHGMLIQAGALVCGSVVQCSAGQRGFLGDIDGQILVRTGDGMYAFNPRTLARNLVELIGLTTLESLTADANGDGDLDAADVVQMVNLCGDLL